MQVIIGSSDRQQIQGKAYLVVSDVLFLNLWIISRNALIIGSNDIRTRFYSFYFKTPGAEYRYKYMNSLNKASI